MHDMRRVMFLMLAAGIAACGHGSPSGPRLAPHAQSTTADDGGESVEPRASSTVAAAIEKADESEEKDAAEPDRGEGRDRRAVERRAGSGAVCVASRRRTTSS